MFHATDLIFVLFLFFPYYLYIFYHIWGGNARQTIDSFNIFAILKKQL